MGINIIIVLDVGEAKFKIVDANKSDIWCSMLLLITILSVYKY